MSEMKVGQVTETVEVAAGAPLLKTEATLVDTIIDAATNDALPLATRNYVELTLLSPGAVHPDPSSFNNGDNVASGARPFINGNREQANNFLLDGMDNNEVSDNLLGYTPVSGRDSGIQPHQQQRPRGIRKFHGRHRQRVHQVGHQRFPWRCLGIFPQRQAECQPVGTQDQSQLRPRFRAHPLRWNMFGGTLGGPVLKNKLFFFVDYQGQRFDHPPAGSFISVYTPAEQAGDFGAA